MRTSSSFSLKFLITCAVAIVTLGGCAADKSPPRAPSADAPAPTTATPGLQQPGYPSTAQAGSVPASQPTQNTPQKDAPNATDPSASSSYAKPPNREAALGQATNDIESSQRELDVAGSSCNNACRALGSMDRAAGRLCGLAQSNDEVRRCSDAKTRVYSARDKVKNTCGSCPDTSVDRTAPIPSK